MATRRLETCPFYTVNNGKLYFVAMLGGGTGQAGGLDYNDGIFCQGAPLPSALIEHVRALGFRVYWFDWEPGIRIEWNQDIGEAMAFVDEDDEADVSEKRKGGWPKGKPRK